MKSKFVGALAVVLLLAGCSAVEQSGAAAVIGDKRLTTVEVADYATEINQTLADTDVAGTLDPLTTNQSIVTLFVRYELSKIMAEALGVAVKKSQIDEEYDSLVRAQGGEETLAVSAAYSNIAPSYLRAYIQTQLNFNNAIAALGDPNDEATVDMLAGMIAAIADEYGIEVSSRYGIWDMATLAVASDTGGAVLDLDLLDVAAE